MRIVGLSAARVSTIFAEIKSHAIHFICVCIKYARQRFDLHTHMSTATTTPTTLMTIITIVRCTCCSLSECGISRARKKEEENDGTACVCVRLCAPHILVFIIKCSLKLFNANDKLRMRTLEQCLPLWHAKTTKKTTDTQVRFRCACSPSSTHLMSQTKRNGPLGTTYLALHRQTRRRRTNERTWRNRMTSIPMNSNCHWINQTMRLLHPRICWNYFDVCWLKRIDQTVHPHSTHTCNPIATEPGINRNQTKLQQIEMRRNGV